MPKDLKQLFESWLEEKESIGEHVDPYFFIVVWSMWNFQNKVIFKGASVDQEASMDQIKFRWKTWSRQWCQFSDYETDMKQSQVIFLA